MNQTYTSSQAKKGPAVGSDQMRVMLNFNRSKQSDMYFLNDYEVTLLKAGSPLPIKQVFDLERDNRITALQAYKLLSGNSLERDVYSKSENGEAAEKKKVWFKLSLDVQDAYGNHPLKKFYPEFKFDLSESIDKYPFKGLTELGKEGMMRVLRNGNLAQADMLIGKKSVQVFVTANPQFKGLDVYDKNMNTIRQDEIFPKHINEPAHDQQKEKTISFESEIGTEAAEDRTSWESKQENPSQDHEIGR
ncbi:hypothetical protein [Pedobacter agri]|uniref:hypothetical protein n=1 Tax=Pedobacter agri TaxID=454586 RepID=UPI002931E377|nr:hypothetical protein [Pedobacter agri]